MRIIVKNVAAIVILLLILLAAIVVFVISSQCSIQVTRAPASDGQKDIYDLWDLDKARDGLFSDQSNTRYVSLAVMTNRRVSLRDSDGILLTKFVETFDLSEVENKAIIMIMTDRRLEFDTCISNRIRELESGVFFQDRLQGLTRLRRMQDSIDNALSAIDRSSSK